MKKQFKQGDLVFSEDGQKAEYVAAITDGHIVLPIVEYCEDEYPHDHLCEPTTWRAVFNEPPVAKFNEELTVLNNAIFVARGEMKTIQEQTRDAERNHEALLKKLKKFEPLRYIDDFLEDRITHYAYVSDYGDAKIIPLAEATCSSDRFNPRLLALYGDRKNKTMNWLLHQYSDSSGSPSSGQWMPARSEDEARAMIQSFIATWLARGDAHQRSYLTSFIRAAKKWGVPVKEEFQAKLATEEEDQRQRGLVNAQAEFDKAKRNLEALAHTAPVGA